MARFIIQDEEWWPVGELVDPSKGYAGQSIYEIPDEVVARYQAAFAEWQAVQTLLDEIQKAGAVDEVRGGETQ